MKKSYDEIESWISFIIVIFILLAILYGIIESGNSTGVFIFLLIVGGIILIFYRSNINDKKSNERVLRIEKAKREKEKIERQIESLSEKDFIAFAMASFDTNTLDECFKKEFKNSNSKFQRWYSAKYSIESFQFKNDFGSTVYRIRIVRLSDGVIISQEEIEY